MRKSLLVCITAAAAAVPALDASASETTFVNRSIASTDAAFSPSRLVQNGTSSSCSGTKPFPGVTGTGTRHFDAYLATNHGTTPACVQIHLDLTCGANTNVTSAGFSPAFNGTLSSGYLGDAGISAGGTATLDYAFLAPPGDSQVIAYEVSPDSGCPNYSLRERVAPSADTTTPTNIDKTSATLTGTATREGESPTFHFQYGTTTAYTDTTASNAVSGGGTNTPVSAGITGLTPDTTYHYRTAIDFPTFGSGPAGSAVGPDRTFITAGPPTAATQAATAVDVASATLNGSFNPHGLSTTAAFEFGKTTAYGTATPASTAGSDRTNHTIGIPVTGLDPSATYHFRAVAKQGGTTVNGADQTFTTPAAPPVTPPATTTTTSATTTDTGTGSATPPSSGATPASIPFVAPAGDTDAPRFTGPPKVSVRKRKAVFTYALSEPATVTIALQRKVKRRKRTRLVGAGTLTQTGQTGPNTLARKLPPGAYQLTATARDAAGNASAPLTSGFRVT